MQMKGKEALAQSRHLPLSVIDHIREMAIVCEEEGLHIIQQNGSFRKMFPSVGDSLLSLVQEECHQEFLENIRQLKDGNGPQKFRMELGTTGAYYEICSELLGQGMVLLRMEPCEDHGWIFSSGELEQIFNDVQEQLEFGTWVYDVRVGRPFWSDGMFRLLDLEKSIAWPYVSDDFYISFIAPEDLERVREVSAAFLKTKNDTELVYSIITAKGVRKIVLMKLTVLRGGSKGVERCLGINKDITHRTMLTNELRRYNELLQGREKLFNFGTWEYEMASSEFSWSEGMYHLYGYEPPADGKKNGLSMDNIEKHISKDERDRLWKIYMALQTDKSDTCSYDYTITDNRGKVKRLESVLKVERDDKGMAVKVFGNTRDITEKDHLMYELVRYRQMIQEKEDFLGQGSYEYDLITGGSTMSRGLLNIFGYKESTDDSSLDLRSIFMSRFDEQEREKIVKAFTELVETNGELLLEVNADFGGTQKALEVYARVYKDDIGTYHRIVGTARDVTMIRKLYNELLEFKEEIVEREILLQHGTWEYDLEAGTVSMSDGLYELIGVSKELDPLPVNYIVNRLVPDSEAKKLTDLLETVMKSGAAYADDISVAAEDGERVYLEFFSRLVRDAEGKPQRIIGIARDVTRLQSYKQELKDQVHKADHMNQQLSEAKGNLEIQLAELEKLNNELRLYKQTMLDKDEFLNQGTWEWDIRSNTYEYSRGMYRLFGYYSKDEMKAWDAMGKSLAPHMDEDEQRRSDEDWEKILAEADTYLREMEIHANDGVKRKLETFGKVFRDDAGAAYKVIGTTRDITQLKEYEQELEVKIDELNRSNKDLEEFAYIASHDLHEPLRKLSTFGQRLVQNAQQELSPQNMDYLGRMLKATDTMRDLIDNLLEFSRVTRGSATFVKHNLGRIIEEVVSEQELRIEETGARVSVDVMPEIEMVPPQIKQLFNNLLSNALKFIRKDVQPEVRFNCRKVTTEEKLRYRLKQGREYYCITVEDNGIGFEKVYADRIFQIFQRLHGKSEYAGSGIGLAICRKIAENHKGLIFADSEPGKGSSFSVLLPNKH